MQAGIQLYQYWKGRLEAMGKIRTAWFTTFNLDISFFEKYILSALMGIDARDMSRPEDYETLSAALNADNTDEYMDVRVFYDAKQLMITGKAKLTAVDLHAMEAHRFGNTFAGGVFHPKVALFENDQGQFWLLTGSFNMTLSGWARNRESFFLEPILDTSNARAAHSFFQSLAKVHGIDAAPALRRLKNLKTEADSAPWKFTSSLDATLWLDEMQRKNQTGSLRIWSPYFSEELGEVIRQLNTRGWSSIEIVPATNENQKIRIETENFEKASAMSGVHFLRDDVAGIDPAVFVHGKVWLTSHAVAIGSWNMTQAGMNIASSGSNNIEAGVVVSLNSRERQAIEQSLRLNPLTNPTCCHAEELNEDPDNATHPCKVVVDLLLDWELLHVSIVSPEYETLVEDLSLSSSIHIPGLGEVSLKKWKQPVSIKSFELRLLTDRFFSIKDSNNNTVYQGYMRERGLSFRPINGFQNLSDCMMSWFTEAPERQTEWQIVNYSTEFTEAITGEKNLTRETHNYRGWFNAFYALECMKKRIDEVKKGDDRTNKLRKIGRVMPGNINEIKKHLTQEQDHLGRSFSENGIYLWFIISKFNAVIEYYNRAIKDPGEFIEPIHQSERVLNELIQSKYDYSPRQINQWKSFIEERLSN
jgi:hypothetical protein